jgi:hypothetical protein
VRRLVFARCVPGQCGTWSKESHLQMSLRQSMMSCREDSCQLWPVIHQCHQSLLVRSMDRTSEKIVSDSHCDGRLDKAAVHTSFHCGTAKAGEGSWQLADATATQVATRNIEKIAMVAYPWSCDSITEDAIWCLCTWLGCRECQCCRITENPASGNPKGGPRVRILLIAASHKRHNSQSRSRLWRQYVLSVAH